MRTYIIIILALLIIAAGVTLPNQEHFTETDKYKDSLTDKDLKENEKPDSGKEVTYQDRDTSKYTTGDKDLKNNFVDSDVPGIPSHFTIRKLKMAKAREALGNTGTNIKEQSLKDITKLDSENNVFDDDLYKGTIAYDYIEGEYSGIRKCHAECSGNCLEFGVTGNSRCFPKNEK